MRGLGMDLVEMPRDNNCLYHALAHFAGGTADTMRDVLCKETLRHSQRYLAWMGLDDDAADMEARLYVENQALEASGH